MNIDILKQKDNFEGDIRPIDLEVDPIKLADFFNSIDDLWPGTWTQGVPYDEKRAKDFVEKRSALKTLVAFDPQNRIVGFCSVHKRMEEPNVSYIGVLGARPDVLGKKYGKYLLLSALEFSVQNGDRRQDLHTWASNMKAVPLYKKIGLQWVPDTSVYMQNYLPVILQDSFCKPFFDRHPDWYLNQIRDVKQAPDDLIDDKMKIFKYRFEEGEDFLEIVIDRYSRSIAGITRKIDGKAISISLKQHDHDVFAGVKESFSLSIINETDIELSAIISFEGSEELQVKSDQRIIKVPIGTKVLENSFIVADTTPDSKIYRKSPWIKSRIILDNELITLEIGMRSRQIIDIFSPEQSWWFPSGKQTLPLTIQNRSIHPLKGELLIWSESEMNIVNPIIPIELRSEENIGTLISLQIPTHMNNDVSSKLFCQVRMENMKSRIFEIPISISDYPSVSSVLLKDQKQIYLQNQHIKAKIRLEGAWCSIDSPDETLMGIGIGILDYGPPFGFSEFNQVEFTHKIIKTPTSIQIRLSKRSQSKSSLIFHRIFELHTGDQHLTIWEEVENLGTINDQITTIVQPFFTNGINMPIGEMYFYFDGKLVTGPNLIWPASKGDLPEGTEHYEPWKCIQADNYTYYHIYETVNSIADPSRSKLTTLEKTIEIPALSCSKGAVSWFGCGKIEWRGVRELAYYLSKKQILSTKQKAVTPISFLKINIPKYQQLVGTKKVDIDLCLNSIRNMPLNGQLTILPPKEWQVNPNKFNFNNLNLSNPHKFKISLILPDNIEFGIANIEFIIDTKGMIKTEKIPFLVYNLDGQPRIEDLEPIAKKRQVSVSNRSIEIVSSVDFAGSLTQINQNESNYLFTNFPNLAPSIFFSKDTGGFFNLLLGRNDELNDLKHLKEKYNVLKMDNSPWHGVEYTVNIHEQKSLKGLVVKTAYELLGGDANFVRVKIIIQNPTTALMEFITFSMLNVGIDGSLDGIKSKFNIGRKSPYYFTRENPIPLFGVGDGDLSYVLFEKNGKSLALFKTNPYSKLFPLDVGKNMLGSGFLNYWSLEPKETEEISFFIVINPPNERFLKDFETLFCV